MKKNNRINRVSTNRTRTNPFILKKGGRVPRISTNYKIEPIILSNIIVYTDGIDNIFINNYKWELIKIKRIIFEDVNDLTERRNKGWLVAKKDKNVKFSPKFPEDFSVYLGGSTMCNVENMLRTIKYEKYDLLVFKNSKTQCVYEDAEITKNIYWDCADVISKQMKHYKENGYPKNHGIFEDDIIIRNNKTTVVMNQMWLHEINKYENSPHIYSFNYVIFKTKPNILIIPDSYKRLT
jgi:hypothetical protein